MDLQAYLVEYLKSVDADHALIAEQKQAIKDRLHDFVNTFEAIENAPPVEAAPVETKELEYESDSA